MMTSNYFLFRTHVNFGFIASVDLAECGIWHAYFFYSDGNLIQYICLVFFGDTVFLTSWLQVYQSGTKTNLVGKILATKFGSFLWYI